MSRYFFNIIDGRSTADTDGTSLPSRQAARREAIRLAGNVLRDDADRLIPNAEWRMEVTDDKGDILFKLDFSFMDTRATHGLARSSSSKGEVAP